MFGSTAVACAEDFEALLLDDKGNVPWHPAKL